MAKVRQAVQTRHKETDREGETDLRTSLWGQSVTTALNSIAWYLARRLRDSHSHSLQL